AAVDQLQAVVAELRLASAGEEEAAGVGAGREAEVARHEELHGGADHREDALVAAGLGVAPQSFERDPELEAAAGVGVEVAVVPRLRLAPEGDDAPAALQAFTVAGKLVAHDERQELVAGTARLVVGSVKSTPR